MAHARHLKVGRAVCRRVGRPPQQPWQYFWSALYLAANSLAIRFARRIVEDDIGREEGRRVRATNLQRVKVLAVGWRRLDDEDEIERQTVGRPHGRLSVAGAVGVAPMHARLAIWQQLGRLHAHRRVEALRSEQRDGIRAVVGGCTQLAARGGKGVLSHVDGAFLVKQRREDRIVRRFQREASADELLVEEEEVDDRAVFALPFAGLVGGVDKLCDGRAAVGQCE